MSDINRDGDKLYAELQQKDFWPEDNYIAYWYFKKIKIVFKITLKNIKNLKKVVFHKT